MTAHRAHRSSLRKWILRLMVLAGASFTLQAATAADIRIDTTSLVFAPVATTPIYVELDWMEDGTHSHKPSQAVIDTIVATFAREGYAININVSSAIPHQAVLATNGSPSGSASVQAIKASYFDNASDSRYFYSIWGHNYSVNGSFTSSSGLGDLPGSTHLVTLGSFSGQVGTFSNQVGTFVHEFGHNIAQRHGGADHNNYKPNYISVMNYYYQLNGLGPSLLSLQFANTSSGFNNFGYSHGSLPSLNEANLNETLGIGLGRARDWNCDGILSISIARDIQASNPCSGTAGFSVLADYDNWSAIDSFVQTGAVPPLFTGAPSEICITPEEDLPIRTLVEGLRAQGLLPDESTLVAPPAGPDMQFASAQSFDVNNDGDTTLTVTGITLDSPAAWVTFEPQSFDLAPGAAQRVYVYVNFATMPGGSWTRRLLVASNDPDESPYPFGVDVSVGGPPGAFGKSSPANGAAGQSSSPTLSWGTSTSAESYQYCYDLTNDNACSEWISTGTNTSVALSVAGNTTHYWQVRAINGGVTTYADGNAGAFWDFTTQAVQGDASSVIGPTNGATGQPTSPTLSWGVNWWPGWQQFVLDLDGDEISDLFLYDPNTGQWHKALSTPAGFTYATGWWNPGWEITPMDLNGDAFGDLFLIDRTTGRWFWVYGEAGDRFTYPQGGYWVPDWALYPGDFNGDGLGDLFLYRSDAGEYYVALNNGAGYDYTAGYGWAAGWTPYVGDFDGNGTDDLFLYSATTGVWFQMISDGVGGFTVGGHQTWTTGWRLYPTDLNGDGRTDFLLYDAASGVWYQARNLVTGSFSYSSGFWSTGLTIITRAPIR